MVPQFEVQLSRLRRGLSAVELVYASHDQWPLPRVPLSAPRLNISVLDASFNPPTLAHLALANTPFPPCFRASPSVHEAFHAKLLLLSVRNADKSLKPSDATYAQRLDMMVSLTKESLVGSDLSSNNYPSSEDGIPPPGAPNIAVGIIDEPTFVGKSHSLLDFLHARLQSLAGPGTVGARACLTPQPKLTFLVGIDTLERLFAPRYYDSEKAMHQSLQTFFASDEDHSRIICGRRVTPGLRESGSEREARIVTVTKDYIRASRVALVDLDEHVRSLSSSEVRAKRGEDEGTWTAMVTSGVAEYIQQHGLYKKLT